MNKAQNKNLIFQDGSALKTPMNIQISKYITTIFSGKYDMIHNPITKQALLLILCFVHLHYLASLAASLIF